MLALILVVVLSGLIVGALARLALPGPDPLPIWVTILLGWGGSLIGGIVSWVFFGHPAGFVLSVVGAIVLVGPKNSNQREIVGLKSASVVRTDANLVPTLHPVGPNYSSVPSYRHFGTARTP